MKRILLHLFLSAGITHFSLAQFLPAQIENEEKELIKSEARRSLALMKSMEVSRASNDLDINYYKLDLTVATNPNYLSGNVTVKVTSLTANVSRLILDLMSSMTVDSVTMNRARLTFTQQPSTVTITLPRAYGVGEVIESTIYYRGVPGSSGFGSFAFSSTQAGAPWVWTLSEPYGAKDWWPCKDHPSDKADSADIWITCDGALKVGSNGKLLAVVDNGDGTKTHKWSTRYPISTYLISIAIANYAEFSNWFKYSPTDSMEVLNYVLPSSLTTAQANLPKAVDMLRIFSDLYGLYPFIKEKYGHSHFGWGGGMEHQTMTSLGGFSENLVAHELAHMWFGDMITCATWPNIWLNEGFATYSVALYQEVKYGTSSYWSYMNGQMLNAKTASGPVYALDSSSVSTLFNGARVYSKGATVLHMLRRVMGDEKFFAALKAYAADPRFRYNVATTENFQEVCEKVSGKQLDYFFQQWIYGQGYPDYQLGWNIRPLLSGYELNVSISNTNSKPNPAFFAMPVDLRLTDGKWDTTVVVFNSVNNQKFKLTLSHNVTKVELDPVNWILRSVKETPLLAEDVPTSYLLAQNYPNPFNSRTTFEFHLPLRPSGTTDPVILKLYDLLGRELAVLVDRSLPAGVYTLTWDAADYPSGVYLYRLQAGDFASTKKLVIIR